MPETINFLKTFSGITDGKNGNATVQIKCYAGDFKRELSPQNEIEELGWFDNSDKEKTTPTGKLILEYLFEKN